MNATGSPKKEPDTHQSDLARIAAALPPHCYIGTGRHPDQPATPDNIVGAIARLLTHYEFLRENYADDIWHWMGDGSDAPDSLTCPVVMSAEQLRGLLAAAAKPGANAAPANPASPPGTPRRPAGTGGPGDSRNSG